MVWSPVGLVYDGAAQAIAIHIGSCVPGLVATWHRQEGDATRYRNSILSYANTGNSTVANLHKYSCKAQVPLVIKHLRVADYRFPAPHIQGLDLLP